MTFTENGGRPGDQRGFVHKSKFGKFFGGAVKTLIPAVGTAVSVIQTGKAFLKGGKEIGAEVKFPQFAQPVGTGGRGKGFRPGRPAETTFPIRNPFGGAGPCDFPMVRDSEGRCRTPTSGEFGGEQFGVGAAVMGRYGAALEPGSQIIDRAICLRGMQLGDDGLCYNKSQISNKQRMWPAGRRPLLSGGDMRAITIAARAGKRLEGASKRLQRLGMMKKPASSRGARPHAHAKAATGVVSV